MQKKAYWIYFWIVGGVITICFLLHSIISPLYFPIVNAPYTQILSILLGIFAALLTYHSNNKHVERKVNISWGVTLIVLGIGTSVALTMCQIYMWCFLWVVAGFKILKV